MHILQVQGGTFPESTRECDIAAFRQLLEPAFSSSLMRRVMIFIGLLTFAIRIYVHHRVIRQASPARATGSTRA